MSRHAILAGAAALIFTVSVAMTVACSASMSGTSGMPMPGGWQMSMAWMRMPGQSRAGAAAAFLGMWVAMMVAMMLPSLVARLRHDRTASASFLLVAGLGYFAVWTAIGVATYSLGVAWAEIEMRISAIAEAVPVAAGTAVVIAGLLQFTAWKSGRLACCRGAVGGVLPDPKFAWRHGLRLGADCAACCANLMAVLLVLGVMELVAMALVTVAITVERVAPRADRAARAIGLAVTGCGVLMLVQATVRPAA